MSPQLTTLGLKNGIVEQIQDLIQSHLNCQHRCDGCLERIEDPRARAELRRLTAMHDRQASELQEIVWSNFESPRDSVTTSAALQQTWDELTNFLRESESALEDAMSRVTKKEHDLREAYEDAIDSISAESVQYLLREHSAQIDEATFRLQTLHCEPNPI